MYFSLLITLHLGTRKTVNQKILLFPENLRPKDIESGNKSEKGFEGVVLDTKIRVHQEGGAAHFLDAGCYFLVELANSWMGQWAHLSHKENHGNALDCFIFLS